MISRELVELMFASPAPKNRSGGPKKRKKLGHRARLGELADVYSTMLARDPHDPLHKIYRGYMKARYKTVKIPRDGAPTWREYLAMSGIRTKADVERYINRRGVEELRQFKEANGFKD